MKKQLLIASLILISVLVNAQTKKDSTVKKNDLPIETSPGKLSMGEMDTSYVLQGNFPDFQLLYKAIASPGDVTPNQISALAAWIQKVQMIQIPKKKN